MMLSIKANARELELAKLSLSNSARAYIADGQNGQNRAAAL